jgi:hypothetical protein
VIFLDFDGVLFDTVREAYAVAVISIGKYNSIDEIDFEIEHFKNFKKLRYLISPAWNYKYLLEALGSEKNLISMQSTFLERLSTSKKEDYEKFENDFFATRTLLRTKHYEKWFRLNIPFPFLYKIKYLFYEYKNLIYIITTKDKATVLKLLSLEGVEFNEKRVFDKEDYKKYGSKKNIIENLISPNAQNIFIDDSDKHIQDCSQIAGLKCFQPDWGYVGLESQTINHKSIVKEINSLVGR